MQKKVDVSIKGRKIVIINKANRWPESDAISLIASIIARMIAEEEEHEFTRKAA